MWADMTALHPSTGSLPSSSSSSRQSSPYSRRSSISLLSSLSSATCITVWPRSFCACTCPPLSRQIFIHIKCPRRAAKCAAVSPLWHMNSTFTLLPTLMVARVVLVHALLALASPLRHRRSITSWWMPSTAICSGVQPIRLGMSQLAPAMINTSTVFTNPFWAATCSGHHPPASMASTGAPYRRRRSHTTTWSFAAAKCSGVCSL
mmetsp:Transcript_5031/g.12075  ORF Transcript_5031/g.12075 Transcript_5031/m.12075 type:complete len:205 (-) Transcript_5031:11-625(-)